MFTVAPDLGKSYLAGADLARAACIWRNCRTRVARRAELQGASLDGAQLQGASLVLRRSFRARRSNDAQLQGASLAIGAKLQGASLDRAQLQGASLATARNFRARRLMGRSFKARRSIGRSYKARRSLKRNCKGASLEAGEAAGRVARSGGSSGRVARSGGAAGRVALWGAAAGRVALSAQLQGASLEAQLQGASLNSVAVNVADFGCLSLARKMGEIDPAELGAVRLEAAVERWKPVWRKDIRYPVPWDAKAYAELRVLMNGIPEGEMRDDALKRIETLDCGNPDKLLASCDPAVKPPPEVLDWQKKLKAAGVDDAAYAKALATELQSLVCTSDANAIYILRGVIENLAASRAGREAPALVDFIMSKDCPVSASLTGDDKGSC